MMCPDKYNYATPCGEWWEESGGVETWEWEHVHETANMSQHPHPSQHPYLQQAAQSRHKETEAQPVSIPASLPSFIFPPCPFRSSLISLPTFLTTGSSESSQ